MIEIVSPASTVVATPANLSTAVKKLAETNLFSEMSLQTDEDEHSIEMHLPYVRKIFEGCEAFILTHPNDWPDFVPRKDISIVPILVGAINKEKEEVYGETIAPYLAEEDTICVISSDFCHW